MGRENWGRKMRQQIAEEIRKAAKDYAESWAPYDTHFEDAAEVAELGYDEWKRRWDKEL